MSAPGLFDTMDTIYLDQPTKAVFKHNNSMLSQILDQNMFKKQQHMCRICLESCPNVQFCSCSGGLLIHEKCLAQFLTIQLQSKRVRTKQLKCEICHSAYVIQTTNQCHFEAGQCSRRICQNQLRCGMYLFFFCTVLVFYCFMGYLFHKNKLSDVTRVSLIIVMVCISLIFLLFLGVWVHQYLFKITQGHISKVLSLEQRKPRSLPGSPHKIHPMPRRPH